MACAACHRAIYDGFQKTPMSATSGAAGSAAPAESLAGAAFTAAASGFRYQVTRSGGGYSMEFEKIADGGVRGKKALAYFVGSGAVARSYLMAADGFFSTEGAGDLLFRERQNGTYPRTTIATLILL